MHVLIADDDPGARLLASAAVERLGHRCTQAEDGADAWRRFQEEPPDVVITGWQMPGMDGTELVRAIRERAGAGYAYVLVVTGAADEAAARAAVEAGADDRVVKPLEVAALERKLIAAERVTGLHRRMHDDARHDPLTGLGNRLRLAEDLETLCARAKRYGHVYCIAVFDVDGSKAYDERAGDDALRAVAAALREQMRSGDALYRYGGEEFLLLLPEQSLESAAQAAARLRAGVEALRLPHPAGGDVTVSAAVAGIGAQACRPEDLFELADQALYRAEEGGRNRVAVHREEGAGEAAVIRLLIADDDPGVRLTVGALVAREQGMELVGEAEDAEEAIELAARRRPDVVVLDFDTPGGGGPRAATEIRAADPEVRIVALSADASPGAQLDMSRAGAVGYLVKGAADDEIVRVIRSSARW